MGKKYVHDEDEKDIPDAGDVLDDAGEVPDTDEDEKDIPDAGDVLDDAGEVPDTDEVMDAVRESNDDEDHDVINAGYEKKYMMRT